MRPMLAGSPSEVSRTVIEYDAEVTGPRGTAVGNGLGGAGSGRGFGAHGGVHASHRLAAPPTGPGQVDGRETRPSALALRPAQNWRNDGLRSGVVRPSSPASGPVWSSRTVSTVPPSSWASRE